MERDEKIFKRMLEHYNDIKNKYEVVGIFLQGSQNYGLDIDDEEYQSDVDTKAIVLPCFEDFANNRSPISTTFVRENNEQIDIKDIRIAFEIYKKQNMTYLETLFTKYKIINPKYKKVLQTIFDNRERIAHIDTNKSLLCQAGMSAKKLEILTHPCPTALDKINKFGYDPKPLHHIFRMNNFIKKYVAGYPFEECLIPDDKENLLKIKKGILPLNVAIDFATKLNNETQEIARKFQKIDKSIDTEMVELLDYVKCKLLKMHLTEELTTAEQTQTFEPREIFVTSDNHFYHDNIIKFENRPFENVDDMNEKMIELWNKKVTDEDMVYIIGDFSFGNAPQTNQILQRLNGKKTLILGNHDNFVNEKRFDKTLFNEITNYKEIDYCGIKFVMCHYPFASNDDKKFQLYGHIHSNKGGLHSTKCILPKNSYNVGVDVNGYVPINLKEIVKKIKNC